MALAVVVYLEIVLLLNNAPASSSGPGETVGEATLLVGLVPNGLFVSIAIAYALGAVRIVRYGALVQQANAIESLSNVDVLCLDKTGTLTANRLVVEEVVALAGSEEELRATLGAVVASAAVRNKTAEAIAAACPAEPQPLAADVPFSSARKWSAVAFAPGLGAGRRSDGPRRGGGARRPAPRRRRHGGRRVPSAVAGGMDDDAGAPAGARSRAHRRARTRRACACCVVAGHPDAGRARPARATRRSSPSG